MDILNWIYLKKQNLIRPLTEPGSVIAIGSPDARRGDSYLMTGILVNDLIGALPLSFTELQSSITNHKLIPGKSYIIIDYQTIYDQPDYDNAGLPKTVVSTLTSITEPLIIIAVSNNEISSQVYSSLFPNDILEYDITFTSTEIMNAPAKGRITSRTDDNKNTTNYDLRAVSFKRYESISGSGIYDSYKDTGFNSNVNIKTFQLNSWNNNLENFYTTASLGIQDFILPNNVISTEFKNNHIQNGFRSNNLGAQFQNNTINSGFRENTTEAGFAFNQIGYDFTNPGITIGTGFISNIIANNFGSNVAIGDNFSTNVIFDNFQNNTIDDNFNNNNIKVSCDNVLPASWVAQPKVYTASYCEVINGFDAGGVAQTQSYLGWFDTALGTFTYSGL